MATGTEHDVTVKQGTDIQKALSVPRRMLSPFEEMDRLFGRIVPQGWLRPMGWDMPLLSEFAEPFDVRLPRVDVFDGEENVVIRAELPAVDKKDLDISVNDTSVTIKGKVVRQEQEAKGEYCRCEIGFGAFSRTLSLPCAVDGSKAIASLKDGLLELTLPKVEKSKRHTIKID